MVLAYEAHAHAGAWSEAHQLVNHPLRAKRVVGDLWADASAADRDAFVDWMKTHWMAHWTAMGRTELGPIASTALTPDIVEVNIQSTPSRRYVCRREGARWRIVGRSSGSPQYDTSEQIRPIVTKLETAMGRRPTLMELLASLPSAPTTALLQLDTEARADDWNSVHARFDYRAKGRSLVPDLWDVASEVEREALVDWLKFLFENTWKKNHASATYNESIVRMDLEVQSPDRAIVRQIGVHRYTTEKGETRQVEHSMNYYMRREGKTWRITDRTRSRAGMEYDGKSLVKRIRQKIHEQLSREPNLGEFVANAPSWNAALRQKKFRIQGLPK